MAGLDETGPVGSILAIAEEFLISLQKFMAMIGPGSEKYLDMYCRGMIFGLHGSTMLVKIANTILKGMTFEEFRKAQFSKDTGLSKKGKKSAGGSIDIIKMLSKKIEEIAKAVSDGLE